MHLSHLSSAPRNRRGGQESHLLWPAPGFTSNLSVTWVEGGPGSEQPQHTHRESEQIYVIVQGRGLMTLDGDERELGAGTLVYIPKGARHSIRNVRDELLIYLSATSPPPELVDGAFAYSGPS